MGWFIIGIIFFLIELYVITHTYKSNWGITGLDAGSYRKYYGIIEDSEVKLPITIGRLLVLIVANIIPIVSLAYFVFFIVWWIKRASDPETNNTACVIWRFKFGKFAKSVLTKLGNLLNKEL